MIPGMNLSDRIKYVLDNAPNVTVAEIATKCGVSVQAVYKWKRGDVKTIEPENLFVLADLTGFSARWIGTGKGEEKESEGDERTHKLAELYAQLDDRGKAAVFRAAESEQSYLRGAEKNADKAA